jgi:hypothetical protein
VGAEEFGREWDALPARVQESATAAGEGETVERLPAGLAGDGAYGSVLVGPDTGDEKGG